MAKIYSPGVDPDTVTPKNEQTFTDKELRHLVNGECARLLLNSQQVLIYNPDAIDEGQELNLDAASFLLKNDKSGVIYGTILVCDRTELN